ncbi:MAG: MBG domain-containing protein [Acidobacteriaceae bacterium]|nr:MBG domain-containing protein [Acidobacteriaceae bacterium]
MMPNYFPARRLRLSVAFLTVLFSAFACRPSLAQSLRFAPVIYNVSSLANQLNNPQGVAVDAAGNLYVVDSSHNQIRKVDPTQTATIFAGTSATGYAGDNGLAINASFYAPNSVAVDPAGNVYVGDTYSYAVRKIDTTGIITTFAGGHGTGSSGDGGAATAAKLLPGAIACDGNGNVYIVDGATVRVVNSAGTISTYAGGGNPASGNGDGGPATAAKFSGPTGLATDGNGNVYIADSAAYVVRKVDKFGNISTFAGNGTYGSSGDGGLATAAQFRSVASVAVDAAGNVYIADSTAQYVRMVNPSGTISTVAGYGQTSQVFDGLPADQARFASPRGVAVDASGNLFISVSASNAIYRVVQHPERFPQTKLGVTSQPQRLILENYGASNISLSSFSFSGDFSLSSTYMAQANPCSQTSTIYSGFNGYCTMDVVFTPTAEGIRSFPLTVHSNDTPGTLTQTLTSTGLGSALAMTSGQMFIVAGKHGGTPGFRGDNGAATAASLNGVNGIAVDSAGDIFFSEYSYCQIRRVDGKTGILTTIAGINPLTCSNTIISGDGGPAVAAATPGVGPMALDASNNLYISDPWDGRIRMIDTNGIIHTFAGSTTGSGNSAGCGYSGDGGAAVLAKLCNPLEIAIDKNGNFYFADTNNNVVRKIDTQGIITTVAGNYALGAGYSGDGGAATAAQLNQQMGVAVNSAGDLFIADTYNNIIRKVSATTGKISTIAGSRNTAGYSGDGGLAVSATLNYPQRLAVDAADNLFIADRDNMVIRKIDTTGHITTVAGTQLVYDGYNGDGLPATATWLAFPQDIAISASGYMYVNDESNQVIRELSPNGTLTFPAQGVGTTSGSQSVTVSNVGNAPMHFDSQYPTGISGDFALASGGTCDFTQALATGSSCSVKINFTPTAAGSRYGIFAFYDDGVAAPQFVSLSGIGTAPQPQSINFTAIPNHVYGDASFNVSAVSSSGLAVTFSVKSGHATISGSTVTVTGVGAVVIAADQAGNGSWLAAATVTQSFNVTPGALTVTAQNASSPYGAALSTLTYVITGFAYSDTISAVSGQPLLSTTATTTSSVGSYPVTAAVGTLAATNYIFNFAAGTYTVIQASQTITFAAPPTHTYGEAAFTISATSDSGLPVSFSIVSGPATVSGSTLTLTGAGQVTVQASQAGNTNYLAATPVQRTFTVHPATLSVTAQNASMVYASTALPSFTANYSGFIGSDTASVVTGTPSFSTTATSASPVGTYPITPTAGTLAAANYTFVFVAGTLTVTPSTLNITPANASRAYGAANPSFTGVVTGLHNSDVVTVTYSSTATATSAVGTYPITAVISGTASANYTAQVTAGTLTVSQAGTSVALTPALTQTNVNTSLLLTAAISPLTSGSPSGTVLFFDGATQLGAGTIAAGSATYTVASLSGGVHHLTATYSGDANFTASTSPQANVTVGDYALTANPPTLTIGQGSSGSTTITFTPTNGYKGTPTLVCSNLPLGATCSFLPASFNADGSNTPSSVKLTISTTAAHNVLAAGSMMSDKKVSVLGKLWLLFGCIALMMLLPIRAAHKHGRRLLALLLALAFFGASGCGSSSPAANPNATPLGTTSITVSIPNSDTAHQLSLTITVN